MIYTEAERRRRDLKAQAFEASSHLLRAVGHMIDSPTAWQRDAFFHEAMKHLSATQGQLLRWHDTICKLQADNEFPIPYVRP